MKIGIIGAGKAATWLLKDIKYSKYARKYKLIVVYDKDTVKAKEMASHFKIDNIALNIREFLDNELDLVYIALPEHLHYHYAKQVLMAGINVYCEKPICLKANELKELQNLASKKHLLLMDGIKTGLVPAYRAMKQEIESGAIGSVEYIYSPYLKISTSGKVPNPQSNEINNGALYGLGVYALYFPIDLLGAPISINYTSLSYPNNKAIQTLYLTLYYKNKSSNINVSDRICDGLQTIICGTKGYIKYGGNLKKYNQSYKKDINHCGYTYEIYNSSNELVKCVDLAFKTEGEGLHYVLDHCYEILQRGEYISPIIKPQLSLQIIKILNACEEPAFNQSKVII